MKFHVEPKALGENQVLPTIRDICDNCNYSFTTNDATTFIVPLTRSYIQHNFGEHSFQAKSSQSVVIVSPTDNSVYKFPFGASEVSNLTSLHVRHIHLNHSALPQEIVRKGHISYHRFNLYHNLLNRIEVRKYIVIFVDQIVDAIQELHANNIAHMDIRLENICYCESTDHAVLTLAPAIAPLGALG